MEMEMHNQVDDLVAMANAAVAADGTVVGAIIDTLGFESLEYLLQIGAITDGVYTLVVEEGDAANLSDAVVVPAELVLGALTGFTIGDDDTTQRVGIISKKRYQRLSVAATVVTVGADALSAIALLGHPKHAPVAQ